MSGYTKLFSTILASTIWRADDKTRLVWITMLAMADRYGVVEASVPGLADFARVSVEDCRRALTELASPDADSRSQEEEGRRIRTVDGGWHIINHGKYRDKLSADERREYFRKKQAEYRKKQRYEASTSVNTVAKMSRKVTHTEAEAEAEVQEDQDRTVGAQTAPTTKRRRQRSPDLTKEEALYQEFRTAYPISRRVGGKLARQAFTDALTGTEPAEQVALMLAALEQHKASAQWQDARLIPLMTTWLRQERWCQRLPELGRVERGKTVGNIAALQAFVARHREPTHD